MSVQVKVAQRESRSGPASTQSSPGGAAAAVASRIAVPHFRRAVSKSEAMNDLLTRYHMALMCQVQQTSLCNSVHDATSRLSRLLLVLSQQGKDDTISFSQERLADMLGLRRSSVTVAAQTLQSRRLISYRRGRIEIVNRKGLKAAACQCYDVVNRTFDQFLEDIYGGPHRRSSKIMNL